MLEIMISTLIVAWSAITIGVYVNELCGRAATRLRDFFRKF